MFRELRRVVLHRNAVLLLVAVAIGNALLFTLTTTSQGDREKTALRLSYLEAVQKEELTEEELTAEQDTLETVLLLFSYAEEKQEDEASYEMFYAEEEAALRETHPEIAGAFDSGSYDENTVRLNYSAMDQVISALHTPEDYHDYVVGVIAQAEQMQNQSIFNMTARQQANISATLDAFSALETAEVTAGNDLPLTCIAAYGLEYLPGIIAAFFLVQKLEEEKRWDMRTVLFSTYKGRSRLHIRRCLVLVAGAAAISAVLVFSTTGIACWFYGPMELSRLVQSTPAFYDFTTLMTTGQFLLLWWGRLTLALSCVSACLWLLYALCMQIHIAFAAFLGLFGLSALSYQMIPLTSALGWFKYLNLYSGAAWMTYGLTYYNLDFFGILAERSAFSAGAQLFLTGCLFVGSVLVNVNRRPVVTPRRWTLRLTELIHRAGERWHAQVERFSYRGIEWYRLLLPHKGVLLIFVFVYLVVQLYPFDTAILSGKERLLEEYYQAISGEVNSETAEWMAELEAALADAEDEWLNAQSQYQAGLIDADTYEQASRRYNAYDTRREAYDEISQQNEYVQAQNKSGYAADLTGPSAYAAVMETETQADRLSSTLTVLLAIWTVWTLYADWSKPCVYAMLRATGEGLHRARCLKARQSAIVVALLYLVRAGIRLAQIQITVGFDGLSSPAHSIQLFGDSGFNGPLWLAVVLWYLLGFLPLLALTSILSALRNSPARSAGLFLGSACAILPDLLALLGFDVASEWTSWRLAERCASALPGEGWGAAVCCVLLCVFARALVGFQGRRDRFGASL